VSPDDDSEIDEAPQDLEFDDDLDTVDEHEARWKVEHASVFGDIEADLDETDYTPEEPVVVLTREAELHREMVAAVGRNPTPEVLARWHRPRRPIIRRLAA
jgi:hypothetical protein